MKLAYLVIVLLGVTMDMTYCSDDEYGEELNSWGEISEFDEDDDASQEWQTPYTSGLEYREDGIYGLEMLPEDKLKWLEERIEGDMFRKFETDENPSEKEKGKDGGISGNFALARKTSGVDNRKPVRKLGVHRKIPGKDGAGGPLSILQPNKDKSAIKPVKVGTHRLEVKSTRNPLRTKHETDGHHVGPAELHREELGTRKHGKVANRSAVLVLNESSAFKQGKDRNSSEIIAHDTSKHGKYGKDFGYYRTSDPSRNEDDIELTNEDTLDLPENDEDDTTVLSKPNEMNELEEIPDVQSDPFFFGRRRRTSRRRRSNFFRRLFGSRRRRFFGRRRASRRRYLRRRF